MTKDFFEKMNQRIKEKNKDSSSSTKKDSNENNINDFFARINQKVKEETKDSSNSTKKDYDTNNTNPSLENIDSFDKKAQKKEASFSQKEKSLSAEKNQDKIPDGSNNNFSLTKNISSKDPKNVDENTILEEKNKIEEADKSSSKQNDLQKNNLNLLKQNQDFNKLQNNKISSTNEKEVVKEQPVLQKITNTKVLEDEKIAIAKITPTTKKVKTSDIINKSLEKDTKPKEEKFEEKIDKVLKSIVYLFHPFKDIILKTLPFLSPLVKVIDIIFSIIAKIIRFIALRIPTFLYFLKSFYFKIIVLLVIGLFLIGTIFSRIINKPVYVSSIEKAIYNSIGYNAKINGTVKIGFLPNLSVSLKNVSFHIKNQDNSLDSQQNFIIDKLNADILSMNFKFSHLIFGNFTVKNVEIYNASLDILTTKKEVPTINYQNIKDKIEEDIKSSLVNEKQALELLNINQQSNEEIDTLDIVDLIKKQNQIEQEKELQEIKEEINQEKTKEEFNALQEIEIQKESQQNLQEANKDFEILTDEHIEEDSHLEKLIDEHIVNSTNILGEGFIYKIFNTFINNLDFSLTNINNLKLRRGKINIVNLNNQPLITINHISANFTSGFSSKVNSDGNFKIRESNIDYNITLDYQENKINYNLHLEFLGDKNKSLNIIGYKNIENSEVIGNISSNNIGSLWLVDTFLIPITTKTNDKASLDANFRITPEDLSISNIKLNFNNDKYLADLKWGFAGYNNINVNLEVITEDISKYTSFYKATRSTVQGRDNNSFNFFTNSVLNWKNTKLNQFKISNFGANIKIANSSFNNEFEISDFNFSFHIDNFNNLYIENISSKVNETYYQGMGKVLLNDKKAIIRFNSKGNINDLAKSINLNNASKELLLKIAKDDTSFEFRGKGIINNNRTVINEIQGYLGQMNIQDSYITSVSRINDLDITINTKIDTMDFTEISDIYNKQLRSVYYESANNINIFGIEDGVSLKLEVSIDNFTVKGLEFKETSFDINLHKSGFILDKLSAKGKNGGNIIGSLNIDANVLPIAVGHLNFNNYFVNLNDVKDIMFQNHNIVGNVVIDGSVKFTSDILTNPLKKVEGEISFIKQERLKLNRFANETGLYMTVSERGRGSSKKIFINDIYGKVKISNSAVEFYPVTLSYLTEGKEYRGTYQSLYDFTDNTIKLEGNVDNIKNLSQRLQFTIAGDLRNPTISRKSQTINVSNQGQVGKQKQLVTQVTKKTHEVVENINNPESKTYFNNKYNINIDEDHKDLKNKLYNDAIVAQNNTDDNLSSFNYPKREED